MKVHLEAGFEDEICEYLAAHEWLYSSDDTAYDKVKALYPPDVWAWLAETDAAQLRKVVGWTGETPPAFENLTAAQRQQFDQVLQRLLKVRATAPVNGGGTLGVLRDGFTFIPAKLRMFQAKPAIGLNLDTAERYASNRLRVMRQVAYEQKGGRELDLVLFLNGIAVATLELKTELTQDAAAGLKQYAHDRPPAGAPLLEFGPGALVHLVVSDELAYMTTRLASVDTVFLPFNQGFNHGKGNPPRPGSSPTAYLWEEILQRDTWLDIVGRFLHYRHEEQTDPATQKKRTVTSLRFPRYHQWRAVTKLEAAARQDGPGAKYLIQHSAGSGKTDSIAWSAHRLAALHRDNGTKVFDGVIVVSDRQVLDGQLSRAVAELESTSGVFVPVTKGSETAKSKQLVDALVAAKQIIGVTLQTFPHALDALDSHAALAGRNYVVIADEAHSSQTGESAAAVKQLLGLGADDETTEETDLDTEAVLQNLMAAKKGRGNVSFVAFTATPKAKTLELFGQKDPDTGEVVPFDLYAMKQAIEEGFILDVLKNYVTYDTAFQLSHAVSADLRKEVDQSKANAELMRWVTLHPHSVAQRVQVVVEHFRRVVRPELGGRAKAMVVTASRKHAIRYHRAMQAYLAEQGYDKGLGVLVAFSGSVEDEGQEYTESSLNPEAKGRAIDVAFKGDEFGILIVANKYQTGFDQPLLVGMYVDKKLSGITAVQTLSRLNRTIPGKVNTYVLDFVNEPDQILSAFQTYYEDATLSDASDPNLVPDMLTKLQAAHIVDPVDVDLVIEQWVHGVSHGKLYAAIKTSVDVFWDRWNTAVADEDEGAKAQLEEFRSTVGAYVRAYDFLSQMIDFGDTVYEKWAVFLRLYARRIQREKGAASELADDIVLTHYRLKKMGQATLALAPGAGDGLTGLTGAGSGTPLEPKYGPLSAVIERINDLFAGTGIGETDQINAIESLLRHAADNETLQAQAMANGPVDFATSPDIEGVVEDAAYAAGDGHSKAIKALLQMQSGEVVQMLLDGGLYKATLTAALEGGSN